MKRSRFTDEQIIGMQREREPSAKTAELCRKHGDSEVTFYSRNAKSSGRKHSRTRREAETTLLRTNSHEFRRTSVIFEKQHWFEHSCVDIYVSSERCDMESDKIAIEYAKAFWTLGNAVTAFSVVQTIAVLITAGTQGSNLRPAIEGNFSLTLSLIFTFTLVYILTVGLIGIKEFWLLKQIDGGSLLSWVGWITVGRLIIIVLMGLLMTGLTLSMRNEDASKNLSQNSASFAGGNERAREVGY